MSDRILNFYTGKSVFLTGASGYLGSVLLEILLRCLPGIRHIYILLRSKNGIEPLERKNLIFQKKIFYNLLKEQPNITDKVKVVSGNISLPHLEISKEELFEITQEVSIVFHCANLLNFSTPFSVSSLENSLETSNVIEFCRKLKKCEVLVYTSTIFANSYLNAKNIEEKIYQLPFQPEKVLKVLDNKDDKSFSQLLSKYNCKWPDVNTFSKCLAENVLLENAVDLPVVVIRPATMFGTLKGPEPGYVEADSGISALFCAIGRGLVTVIRGDKNVTLHLIPADIVANTIIASAWCLNNNRFVSPLVVNCTSGKTWNTTVSHFTENVTNILSKNLLPNSFQSPSLMIFNNKFCYELFRFHQDVMPAFMFDIVLFFKTGKFRLIPIQRNLSKLIANLAHLMTTHVTFDVDNFHNISKNLHPEDKEVFYIDLKGSELKDILYKIPDGSNLFNWKGEEIYPNKLRHLVYANTMTVTFIRRFSLLVLMYFIYYVTVFKL